MLQQPVNPAVQLRRIAALDILRGLAILGTFATNAGLFIGGAYRDVEPLQPALDAAVETFLGLVTDGKWIGLLTIMFGIGLEIQRQSALRKGQTWLGSYPWRAAILILDGLLNYFFIFEFDVLMGYGITGIIVALVLVTTPRVQKWVMGIGISIHVGVLLWQDLGLGLGDEFRRRLRPDEVLIPEEEWDSARFDVPGLEMDTSSYWSGVVSRWDAFWTGGRAEIPTMLLMGLGLFLVGSHLYRAGIFEERGRRLRIWVMGLAFGVGLPLDWGTRLFADGMVSGLNRYFTSACVSIGLLALVAHLYARGRQPGLHGRLLTNVGRMALTCYIGQNLIASILLYEWGFGLDRYLNYGVWNTIIVFTGAGLILIAFATVWLRFFKRGPVEWLWHWMYLRLVRLTFPLVRRWHARRGSAVAMPV